MSCILRLGPKPDCSGEPPSSPVLSFIVNLRAPIYFPLRSGVKTRDGGSILLLSTALSEAPFFLEDLSSVSSPAPRTEVASAVGAFVCLGRTGWVCVTNHEKRQPCSDSESRSQTLPALLALG